jgi:tetratricopeptide (TPR) repeat protein
MQSTISVTIAVVVCAVNSRAFASTAHARSDVPSLVRDGYKALANNRNADAIGILSTAIDRARHTRDFRIAALITVAYSCRADAYEKLYQFDKAIADYSEAIRRNPQWASTYAERGLVYAEIRRFDKANADYTAALRIDPKNKATYALRGDTARLKGQWDAALRDAAKAIILDPKYARAYQVRGRAYEGKKEYTKAIDNFEQTMRLSPTYLQAYLARADTICETGDFAGGRNGTSPIVEAF